MSDANIIRRFMRRRINSPSAVARQAKEDQILICYFSASTAVLSIARPSL